MKKTIKNLFFFLAILVVTGYAVITAQAQQDSLLVQSNSGADIIVQKFINQINILSSVKVETSLFSEQSFRSFVDWSRPIPEEEKGRPNPFAPIN